MAKQTINIGTGPNTKTGDPLRTAFTKVNENFTELYAGGSVGATGAAGATGPAGSGSVDLSAIDQSIIPDTNVAYDLGSTSHRFKDLYLSGSTIYLGNNTISSNVGGLLLSGGLSLNTSYSFDGLLVNQTDTYNINDTWTMPTDGGIPVDGNNYHLGPFPYGARILGSAPNPASNSDAAKFDYTYDGSNYLTSITLIDGGTNYGPLSDQLLVERVYGSAEVLSLTPPSTGILHPIQLWMITDPAMPAIANGDYTASWTDGTRTVVVNYTVADTVILGDNYKTIYPTGSSVTGNFVGGELVEYDGYNQYPHLVFKINYDTDETALLWVDLSTETMPSGSIVFSVQNSNGEVGANVLNATPIMVQNTLSLTLQANRYTSTANNTAVDATPINTLYEKAFLAPGSGISASYIIAGGQYDGQTIEFYPQAADSTNLGDVESIRVFSDRLYSATSSNGRYSTNTYPWYPFQYMGSQNGAPTLTWDALNSVWIPFPYNYD